MTDGGASVAPQHDLNPVPVRLGGQFLSPRNSGPNFSPCGRGFGRRGGVAFVAGMASEPLRVSLVSFLLSFVLRGSLPADGDNLDRSRDVAPAPKLDLARLDFAPDPFRLDPHLSDGPCAAGPFQPGHGSSDCSFLRSFLPIALQGMVDPTPNHGTVQRVYRKPYRHQAGSRGFVSQLFLAECTLRRCLLDFRKHPMFDCPVRLVFSAMKRARAGHAGGDVVATFRDEFGKRLLCGGQNHPSLALPHPS